MTGARLPRFAPLAALALLAARPAFAQAADSALTAELKRYLRDGEAVATAPASFDSRDWAEAAAISGGLSIAPVISPDTVGFTARVFF